MSIVTKPDFNLIFASQAPSVDLPPQFNNYVRGMDETRKNNGKPTIKQFNYLHQNLDLKLLWILQNGAALPYDSSVEYAEDSLAVKDGELQQFVGGVWSPFKKTVDASDVKDESGLSQQEINAGIESIQELRDIIPRNAMQLIVRVNSHTAGFGIGGDNFIFSASSTLPDDDGRVVKPHDADVGRWIRLNNRIDIEQYGAIPLSIADIDSTLAIEKCALSNEGKQVNVPADKYKITRALLPINCCFVGENGSSVYELKSEFILSSPTAFTLFPESSKVQLENMCLSGGQYGVAPVHTLAFEWSNYGSIPMRNCRIRRFVSLGDIAATYIDFYDVFISECTNTFYLTQNYYNQSSTVIGFHSCRFTYSKHGIQTKSKSGATMQPTNGVYFYNCGFEDLDEYGIAGNLMNVAVRDCWFENVKGKYNVVAATVIQETNVAAYAAGTSVGVNYDLFTCLNGYDSRLPRLQIADYLTTPRILSDTPLKIDNGVRFKDGYISGSASNVNALGEELKQSFTSDSGTASAAIQFLRTNQGGSGVFQGSGISFKTGRLTGYDPDPMREQWRIDGYGHFLPQQTSVNIGSAANKVSKVFTANANISDLGTYTDNAAAKSGGLTNGDLYKTSTGQLMVVY